MKQYKLGDIVAADMYKTLENESFKKIFSKASTPTAVNPDLLAFNKFAAKKDEEDDDGKKKSKKGKQPPWLKKKDDKKDDKDEDKGEKKSKKKKEDKKDEKKSKAAALRYIIKTLNKTSAALDAMNLTHSSMATLGAMDVLVREASVKLAADDDLDDLELGEEDGEEKLEQELSENPELLYLEEENRLNDYEKESLEELKSRLSGEDEVEDLEEDDIDKDLELSDEEDMDFDLEPGEELDFGFADDKEDKSKDDEEDEDEDEEKPAAKKTDQNQSDDYVPPSALKSSIEPKLNDSSKGHKHDSNCVDCGSADDNLVQAFKSLENWVKNSQDFDMSNADDEEGDDEEDDEDEDENDAKDLLDFVNLRQ